MSVFVQEKDEMLAVAYICQWTYFYHNSLLQIFCIYDTFEWQSSRKVICL